MSSTWGATSKENLAIAAVSESSSEENLSGFIRSASISRGGILQRMSRGHEDRISDFNTEIFDAASSSDDIDLEDFVDDDIDRDGSLYGYDGRNYESSGSNDKSTAPSSSSREFLFPDRQSPKKETNKKDTVNIPNDKLANMFLTSYTRSTKSDPGPKLFATSVNTSPESHKSKRQKTPDKKKLCGTLSNDSFKLANSIGRNVFSDLPMTSSPPLYNDDNMSQITEHLFVGNAAGVNDCHLLCKFGIDAFVNLSSAHVPNIVQGGKLFCKCRCRQPGGDLHFRSTLNIKLEHPEEAEFLFQDINKFIESCTRKKMRVLIYSNRGKSRACTAAIQYLMTCMHVPVKQAYEFLKTQRPLVSINAGFTNYLWKLNSRLNLDNQVLSLQDVNISLGYPRPAWQQS